LIYAENLFAIINATGYPTAGTVVIDARGINTTNSKHSSGNLLCAGTPWFNGTNASTSNPATILLPAATILISSTWILPDGSKVIGEGSGGGSSGTTLEVSGFTGSEMIELGDSGMPTNYTTYPCPLRKL
jgi:hypothetical protein